MANIVSIKEALLVNMWTNASGTRGQIDKIGIYGSISEGSVQIIDDAVGGTDPQDITWADATTMTADVVFNVPADTQIFGVVLFDSSDLDSPGVYNYNTDPYFDYNFSAMGETPYSYTNQGLFTIKSLNLGVE